MLLDDALPHCDFKEVHSVIVQASASRTFAAIKEVTLKELPLFRVLMQIRNVPSHVTGRPLRLPADHTLFQWALESGFILLAEAVDRELVFGTVGQFWKLSGGRLSITDAQDFLAFEYPGYVKVATNIYLDRRVEPLSTRLITETRINALGAAARRSFALYWRLIYPGSAVIRREWLAAIKRRAEGTAGT